MKRFPVDLNGFADALEGAPGGTVIVDPSSPEGQRIIEESAREQPATPGDPPPDQWQRERLCDAWRQHAAEARARGASAASEQERAMQAGLAAAWTAAANELESWRAGGA